jgi:osmoprotectant transport system permease protein
MLPALRNTVTGLNGIDPAVTEAAAGVGMTRREALLMVELPLALPVIMAGIRTSAVWVIGTATLSTPVGQTSLGNYIFTGLQTQNWVFVLFGCVAAAVLALAVDQLLALMQTGAATRRRGRIALGAAGLAALTLAALAPGLVRPSAAYVVGAKTFTEQYVLSALMQERIEAAGFSATRRAGLGSSVIFTALAGGEIDAYVDYSGTIWANQMRRSDVPPRAEVMAAVGDWLARQHRIVLLGGLGFENAYALAMSRRRAQALGVRSIADLAQHAPRLAIAGDYEFFARPEWTALRSAYGLNFRERRQMQPEFMYPAAANGDVDVISAFSSDGQVVKFDLVLLDDPRHAIPPYDAIILVSPRRADDRALIAALTPLIGSIDADTMRAANLRASAGGAQGLPEEVARWLWEKIQNKR